MKKTVLFFLFILMLSCNNSDNKIDAPTCIETKILEIKKSDIQNSPAAVWKWDVDGETYYYITSDCCDQYNYLYYENCEIVCAPDGGFTGNGDGNCPTFSSDIVKTLIWEDDRK
jgi:hypothetical protein